MIIRSKCLICMNELKREIHIVTKCGHEFHVRCIVDWLDNNNNCPVCDSRMRENRLLHIKDYKKCLKWCFFIILIIIICSGALIVSVFNNNHQNKN